MVFTKAIPVAPSTVTSACRAMRRTYPDQGFTLVELMLVALLGCLLCGMGFQVLFAETRQGGSLAESLQLKQWQHGNAASWSWSRGIWSTPPAGGSTRMHQLVGPALWLVGNPSSPSSQRMAPILFFTASDRRQWRFGAVQY